MATVCDEHIYASLYSEHGTNLRNFLYYKCGDLDKAEDMAQDAYIKLWENCKKVTLDSAKGFLFTVANRLFLNLYKRDQVSLKFQKEKPMEINSESPEFTLEEKEFKVTLEQAISNLTEAQREVFLMNRIDKMSYAEIAKTLDISVKAVEKRMHKALLSLKEKVDELKTHKF